MSLPAILYTRRLLLVDAIGALVSAVMLGFVLPFVQQHIGLSVELLHLLAIIAVALSVWSAMSYLFSAARWRTFLLITACANAGYCLFTGSVLVRHAVVMEPIGWLYFVGEMALVLLLLGHELRVARSR